MRQVEPDRCANNVKLAIENGQARLPAMVFQVDVGAQRWWRPVNAGAGPILRLAAARILAHADHALALARQLDRADLIARNLNLIAMTTIVLGNWQRSKASASEAASLYLGIEDHALEANSLGHIANAQLLAGEFQDALVSAQRMRQIRLEIQNTWTNALSDLILAAIYRDTGFYTEALDSARASVSMARTTQILIVLMLSHMVLGTVYRALRQLDDACAIHLEIMQIVGQPSHVIQN